MDAISTMLLGFAILRGEHIPQGELPYLDALPLGMAKRTETIARYVDEARLSGRDEQGACYWTYREGTRRYLRTLSPMEAAYMYGRLIGRHFMWGPYLCEDGQWRHGWIDEAAEAPEPLPTPREAK